MDETKNASRKDKHGNPTMNKELRSWVLAELGGGPARTAPKGFHLVFGPGLTRKQLAFPKTAN